MCAPFRGDTQVPPYENRVGFSEMNTLIGTPTDHKNIGLVKLLYELRQDLDVFCLLALNAHSIKQRGVGISFFGRLQQIVDKSIVMSICNIYEYETKEYELNSIHGVFRYLRKEVRTTLNDAKLKAFIQKYNGPLNIDNQISAIESTIKGFRKKYRDCLERFETFRNKKIAHSEFGDHNNILPSYEVMEKLFLFGTDFYDLVANSFVGFEPYDFRNQGPVKTALIKVFRKIGIEDIKTDME